MESNKKLTLTEDQQQAFEEFQEWLGGSEWMLPDQYKTLKGYAGTGKTALLDYFVNYAQKRKLSVAVTATTNKAVKVLSQKITGGTVDLSTIHSLLNIKVKRRGTQEIFEPVNWDKSDITEFDLVIIDEASMISSIDKASPSLLTLIKNQTEGTDTQVLFCGDPAQLQPIGETVSKCFDFNPSTLHKVVRHDDGIANVAKLLREKEKPVTTKELLSPPDVEQITKEKAHELFKGFRDDPDRVRLLTWRNASVDIWNRDLRFTDYGEVKDEYLKGDIIIANSPCIKTFPGGEDILLMNSEEAIILKATEGEKFWKLRVKNTFNGREVKLKVIKKTYAPQWERSLQELAKKASVNPRLWKNFWDKKKSVHDIRHCYAMTVHKSQGSTFDTVVVDTKDINTNRDVLNRNQLLYVAITRAAKRVYLL